MLCLPLFLSSSSSSAFKFNFTRKSRIESVALHTILHACRHFYFIKDYQTTRSTPFSPPVFLAFSKNTTLNTKYVNSNGMEAAAPYFDLNEVKGISISLRTRHQICDFALTILRLFCSPYINIMAIFATAKKSRGAFFLEIGNVMCLFGIFSVKSTFFSATPASTSSTSFFAFS